MCPLPKYPSLHDDISCYHLYFDAAENYDFSINYDTDILTVA